MITAAVFIAITFIGSIFSLTKAPFWGLIVYTNLYMNPPRSRINWWADYLPNLRWSLLVSGVLLASVIIHSDKLSRHKLSTAYWVFALSILSALIANTIAVAPIQANIQSYSMLTYSIIIVFIIKILAKFDQLRLFILIVIVMNAYLSIKSHFEGKYFDGRLNNIGPIDAHSSNEYGLMLSMIIPLTLPFIFQGKRHEKAICIISLLLILNTLILTVSRGAFVALLCSTFYGFVFIANKKIKKKLLVAGICIIPIFLYLAADENYFDRVSSLWSADVSSEEAVNTLSSGRMEIWKYGYLMTKDYPFGSGPGGFKELARYYMPDELLTYHPGALYGVRAAHNTYLQVMVELGYSGLCIFLLILFGTMYKLFQCSKKLKQIGQSGSFIDLLVTGLSMSFFCILVGGIFGGHLYYEFFWWLVAIAVVVNSFVLKMKQEHLEKMGVLIN